MKLWKENNWHIVYNTISQVLPIKILQNTFKTPLTKVKYQRKKQKKTLSLSQDDFTYFAQLLENGYPMLDALDFLNVDTSYIQTQLESGNDVINILTKHQTGKFYDHLRFFLEVSPLPYAIQSAQKMKMFETAIRTKLLKQSSYPLFILAMAYALMLFFVYGIIPQMMASFANDTSMQSMAFILSLLNIICFLGLLFGLSISIFFCMLCRSAPLRIKFFIKSLNISSLISDYNAYIFAGYMLELEKRGVSTKQSIQYLSHIKKESFFTYFIEDVRKQLETGNDLLSVLDNSIFLNANSKKIFRIGILTSSLCDLLPSFMIQQESAWEKKLKRIGISIQIVAYSFVGILVLLVYQIMLIPLSMLETM